MTTIDKRLGKLESAVIPEAEREYKTVYRRGENYYSEYPRPDVLPITLEELEQIRAKYQVWMVSFVDKAVTHDND